MDRCQECGDEFEIEEYCQDCGELLCGMCNHYCMGEELDD